MDKSEYTIKKLIERKIKTSDELGKIKREISKKFGVPCPSNIQLLKEYHTLLKNKIIKENKRLEDLLKKRPVRSLSGIINVSVLTKPYPCPGECIFCPQAKGLPKSYLPKEPAVMRATSLNFDPYLQVQKRILSLEKMGHYVDKMELRIIGGTWSYYPKNYQTWFIKRCFQAANEIRGKRKGSKTNLEKEKKRNEKAKYKIIGVTVETRPDFITVKEVKRMRKLGITRVELGVQSIYNDVLKINKRGHTIKETIKATKLLKDTGIKVLYQMMPNLLGSDFERDVSMFKELFSNPDFQPDLLKIYPLALIKETPLYKWHKKGEFRVYSKRELINLLVKIKKEIPYYCRIQRIVRDIPSGYIVAGGAKISNIREIVQKEMAKERTKCKCIRCREVKENYNPKEKIYLFREDYEASGGKEIFLSFENKDRSKLYALLRLRIPSYYFSRKKHFIKILRESAIIREVHVYGQMIPVGQKSFLVQHRGLGKKLIKKAEKIAKNEFGLKKMAVISGVGAREYYKKLGYKLKDEYMIKKSH